MTIIAPLGDRFGISREIYHGIFTGMLEITNGVKLLSARGVSRQTLIAAAAVISWGGLSIHAQSISFLGKTKIRPLFYLSAKLVNVCFAVFYGHLIYPLFPPERLSTEVIAVSNNYDAAMIDRFFHATTYFGLIILAVLIIGLAVAIYSAFTTAFRKSQF
jgi:hypothetical protein